MTIAQASEATPIKDGIVVTSSYLGSRNRGSAFQGARVRHRRQILPRHSWHSWLSGAALIVLAACAVGDVDSTDGEAAVSELEQSAVAQNKVTLTLQGSTTVYNEQRDVTGFSGQVTGVSVAAGWSVYLYDRWTFDGRHTCYKEVCFDNATNSGSLQTARLPRRPETIFVRNHPCRANVRRLAPYSVNVPPPHHVPVWKKLLNIAVGLGGLGTGEMAEPGEGFAPDGEGFFPHASSERGFDPFEDMGTVPDAAEESAEAAIGKALASAKKIYTDLAQSTTISELRVNSINRPTEFSAGRRYGQSTGRGAQPNRIWVREDADPPVASRPPALPRSWKGAGEQHTYYEFEPSSKYLADCCHTAEEIMAGKDLPFGMEDQTRVEDTDYVWGTGDDAIDQSIRTYAGRTPGNVNNNASPKVGQAYAILRRGEPGPGQSPYHVAAVVARDGTTTITMEVSAGEEDAAARDQTPEYYLYSTRPSDTNQSELHTFHSEFNQASQYGPNATTVVIEPIRTTTGGSGGNGRRRDLGVPSHGKNLAPKWTCVCNGYCGNCGIGGSPGSTSRNLSRAAAKSYVCGGCSGTSAPWNLNHGWTCTSSAGAVMNDAWSTATTCAR